MIQNNTKSTGAISVENMGADQRWFDLFLEQDFELQVYLVTGIIGNPDTWKTRFIRTINYFKCSLNTYAIIHQREAASTNVHEFPERIYNLANTVHSECVTARTDLQETICLHDDCILWHFQSIWISKTWIAGI